MVGWQKFREDEENLIKEITISDKIPFLSLGGGSLSDRILEHFRINNVKLVWLRVEFRELIRRANISKGNRPLLVEKKEGRFLISIKKERNYTLGLI